MAEKKRIFLVDGSGLVYRAHFAFLRNPLITTTGEHTSAIYGFLNALLVLLRDENPDELVVAFDVKGKTFRHEMFDAYKANRPPQPPELRSQIPRAKELLDAMKVARVEQEGMEADDLIGSLAATAVAAGKDAVIVSADKDFMQLIQPGIRQWIPPKMQEAGKWVGPDEVQEKWGVSPEQMVDLLALMGDTSDNVPGVPGVGPKTASKLLEEYGSLDGIYEHLEEIPQKGLKEKLRTNKESAFLSRDLVRIRADLDVGLSDESARVPLLEPRPDLVRILRELEFQRILEMLGPAAGNDGESVGEAGAEAAGAPASQVLVVTDAKGLAPLAKATGPWAIDVWMEGRPPRPVGLGLVRGGKVAYVPVHSGQSEVAGDGAPGQVSMMLGDSEPPLPEELRARLDELLSADGTSLLGHDLKAALHGLRALGLSALPSTLEDSMLSSYLVDPETSHAFDTLVSSRLGRRLPTAQEVFGVGKQKRSFHELESGVAAEFMGERARAARDLVDDFRPALEADELTSLWTDLECPLIPVLLRMERAGIALDVDFLTVLGAEMESDLTRLTREIHEAAGREFNIGSPLQLSKVLFEELGLPKKKKTKTGFSTDAEVLETLAELHAVPRLVLEHRLLSKLKGTYVDALPALVDPDDGRIHASFHQAVAATGRLSSSDPNIQNIPIRSEAGRRIRQAFIAPPGRRLISADYSQVELRVLAHLSRDEGLREAFASGYDVHTATAARLFGVPPEEVGVELRSRSKAVNFGVIYGMGPQRLSREMGISMQEAKDFIADYFAKMPGVKGYLEQNLAEARERGYTTTIFGRRRRLPGLSSADQRVRAQAERICSNTPIQGSAADLMKKAMIDVDRELLRKKLDARLLLQVHDELVVEAHESCADEVQEVVVRCMEDVRELFVPLEAQVGSGRTWAEAHG